MKKKKWGKKEDVDRSTTVADADDTNSEESPALVADEQPHFNDVWILDSGVSSVCKVVAISTKDMTKLWHMRLGHTGERWMKLLSKLDFLFGHKFNEFYKNDEIVRHHTIRHTTQQNGMTKRMNQTLLKRARCQSFQAGLTMKFWVETVNMTCDLINVDLTLTLTARHLTRNGQNSFNGPRKGEEGIFTKKTLIHEYFARGLWYENTKS
ncbi:hypothetical protein SASPL_154212 [Salvia splendens]|uniref:GAG-pre-integrase domain-containing protein n=1 Tax=Salvia splendens TaxID=180675 RepID=A0A8X8YY99_SALSN|nr:hypothetical protein SASPL_154212 [Salvia splendens]